MKSSEYRPIIGFLTGVIDQSFQNQDALSRSGGQDGRTGDRDIARVRARLDAAYRALEKLLELILQDLDGESAAGETAEASTKLTGKHSEFLAEVFPNDDAGRELLNQFYKRQKFSSMH